MTLLRIGFFATLLALTVGAIGQTIHGNIVVDVPFAFSLGSEQFPAGHYTVEQTDYTIRIFDHRGKGLNVPIHAAYRTNSDSTKLVFHRYGDHYFLWTVWVKGNASGKELYPSHAEREFRARQAEMELAVVRPVQ